MASNLSKKRFGVDSKILWLPDVFGYSAALPQILRKAELNICDLKISWNDTNKLPYDSFLWKGIDGSEIFTNFLTAQDYPPDGVPVNYSCYNGDITPSMVKGAYNRYQQKEYSDRVMDTFGYGDGGGGPTRKMLEQQRRHFPKRTCRANPEDGNPYGAGTILEMVQKEPFTKTERRFAGFRDGHGELYLEYHRGTYTSMAPKQAVQSKDGISASKGGGTGGGSFSIV